MVHNSVMIVISRPTSPEEEASFNKWYSDVHLPEIVALPGVASAARYKLANLALPSEAPAPTHQYIAIYELMAVTDNELQAFVDNMNASINAGGFDMSGPMDFVNVDAMLALRIGQQLQGQNSDRVG